MLWILSVSPAPATPTRHPERDHKGAVAEFENHLKGDKQADNSALDSALSLTPVGPMQTVHP